jgi:hypothetical protein
MRCLLCVFQSNGVVPKTIGERWEEEKKKTGSFHRKVLPRLCFLRSELWDKLSHVARTWVVTLIGILGTTQGREKGRVEECDHLVGDGNDGGGSSLLAGGHLVGVLASSARGAEPRNQAIC